MEKEKVSSGNIIDFKVLKRIFEFIKPYKGRFYLVIILTFFLGFLSPYRIYLTQLILDDYVAKGNYQMMLYFTLITVVLLVIQSIIQYVHTYISGRIGQYVIRDIRIKLY